MSLDYKKQAEKTARVLAKIEKRENKKAKRKEKRQQRCKWFPGKPTVKGTVHGVITMILLIASAINIGVMSLQFSTYSFGREMFDSWFATPSIAVLNIVPVVLLALFMYFLTMRAWLANLTTGAVISVLTLINYFKLSFRDDPFLFEDVLLFKEAGDMAGKYEVKLTREMWLMFAVILITTLILALIGRARFRALALRAITVGLSAAAILVFIFSFAMNSNIYNSINNTELINKWNATQVYISKGFIYPFLNSMSSAFPDKTEGYSKEAAEEILAEYNTQDIPEDEQINVIGIMLEAYSDFSKYDSIEWRSNPYDIWHKIERESIHGEIVTNIFAGGTVDSERTFLTGYSDYGSLRKATESYVSYFTDQGYFAEGAHPCFEWFYNRSNVNANLGFNQYWFVENRYTKWTDGDVAYDYILFPDLIKLYKEGTKSDKPYFQFNVTYQNHGPYPEVLSGGNKKYVSSRYSDVEENIANNYFNGIRDTSVKVWSFLNQLRYDEEPVVVVMFGDHNPWFGEGNSVYNELGINIDTSNQEGFLNYYSTPYYIWANNAAKKLLADKGEALNQIHSADSENRKTGDSFGSRDFAESPAGALDIPDDIYSNIDFKKIRGQGPTVGPYYLMNVLFEVCGWEGNAYMQFTDEIMKTLPIIHSNGAYLTANDGIMKTEEQLSEEEKQLLNKYKIVEYYMKYDYKSE